MLTGGWNWVLSLWWVGPRQEVCLEVAVCSRGLYAACLLMDGALFSSCCLFGPRHPSTGDCGLVGEAILNAKMVTYCSSHTFEYFLGATSDLAPHSRPLPTPNFLRDPQRSSGRLAHCPMKSLLCLRSQSMWNFVATLQDWTLFFPVLWSSWTQALLAFETKWLGSLMWGSELTPVREPL